jgi:GAF domain-containing protein
MVNRDGRGEPSSSFTGRAEFDNLALQLSQLARALQEEPDVSRTLDEMVAAAVDTVPGAQMAGLMVVQRRGQIETRAATDEVVRQVDQLQFDTGQGPCLAAIVTERTVRLSDTLSEERWPEFGRGAAGLGVRSMLSFQLYVQQDNLGALNLYAKEPDAFTDESEHVGLLFAAHAAVAMIDAQQIEQLAHAVTIRELIGQAKGILMERHKLTADQAFLLLVRASQRTNTKLVDVARHLTETGEVPGDPDER